MQFDNQFAAFSGVEFGGKLLNFSVVFGIGVTGAVLRVGAVDIRFPVPRQENFRVAGVGGRDIRDEQVVFALNAHVVNQVVVDGVNFDVKAEVQRENCKRQNLIQVSCRLFREFRPRLCLSSPPRQVI